MHKSNINLETIIKQIPSDKVDMHQGLPLLGTRVSLLKAWRLRILQLLMLRLPPKASNGSYTV
jgi:hypothetical protein